METTSQKNKPSYECAAFARMAPAWKVTSDVAAGTLKLRERGEEYLPKFPAEHPDDYKDRLKTATVFNALNRTQEGLVGMTFRKNPTLEDDVPLVIKGDKEKGLEGHVENIDLAGAHFDTFAKNLLKYAIQDGHGFILVDMQRPLGPTATLEDERRSGMRPYWVRYRANQAVNFRPVTINGEVEIGQITFEEKTTVEDGDFGEKEVLRYRTFKLEGGSNGARRRVSFVLRDKQTSASGEEVFVEIESGVIPKLTRIPVAVVYGKQTGFLESTPVLLDLAFANIKYYQKRSDYDSSLHKAGFPIPVFIGMEDDENKVKVGPGFGIRLPVGGDAKYLETAGASLEAARLDLQDVRGEMAALGLAVISARQDDEETATETLLNFSQESSELETIARSLSDALELALSFHAKYIGEKTGGSIDLGSHLKSLALTPAQVATYSNMVAANQLTLRTLWSILQSGDALPDSFDADEEETGIKKQQAALGEELLRKFDRGADLGAAA